MRARALWILLSLAVLVGLVAWSTTCTGPRPVPTGDTLPPEGGPTTTVAPAGDTVPSTLAPPPS